MTEDLVSQRPRISMANISSANLTGKFSNTMVEKETRLPVPARNSYTIVITINSIACPFTVLLNVLVILAVKRRPRLRSKSNILLACLAATDAASGFTAQPAFIFAATFELLYVTSQITQTAFYFLNGVTRALFVCSSLHLILVTGERLAAIKFTPHYPYIITERNIKVTVIAFWIISLITVQHSLFSNAIVGFVLTSCVLFVSFSYVLLYRETRRHEKKIKTRQLPQEEVERFAKESKVLKTTVYVVGAVILCLIPVAVFLFFTSFLRAKGDSVRSSFLVIMPLIRTCGLINSLLNPLIYCWRQQEMRKFVFSRFSAVQNVNPVNQ